MLYISDTTNFTLSDEAMFFEFEKIYDMIGCEATVNCRSMRMVYSLSFKIEKKC